VTDTRAVERSVGAVAEAERDANVVVGGGRSDGGGLSVEPTVVPDVRRGHRLTPDEPFASLVMVTCVGSLDETARRGRLGRLRPHRRDLQPRRHRGGRLLDEIQAGVANVNRPAGATARRGRDPVVLRLEERRVGRTGAGWGRTRSSSSCASRARRS
jgi:acyl-CoA reductase-like NAD-dependent aldehyde dehydrogenase